MRSTATVLGSALIAVCAAPPHAHGASAVFFRTPSGSIDCAYVSGTDGGSLRCDVRGGLKPLPPRGPGCEFDWGAGYRLRATGRARVSCVSDAVATPSARILRYGTAWRAGGIICHSRRVGLRCRNRSGRGFFLSRQHSYRF